MRILIDCAHIDFSRQPTGIPRVVLKYIEEGYRWSERSGVQVIPVVARPAGLALVHPLPGRTPPQYLENMVPAPVSLNSAREAIERHIDQAAFHLQAALQQACHEPRPADCLLAARHAVDRLIERAVMGSSRFIAVEPGDILFCPAYWHDVPPTTYQGIKAQGARIVVLVHDILPITFSKFYQAPWKYDFEKNLISAIKYSDELYAVSRYTANSVSEFAARNGLGDIDVGVSHNGYDELLGGKLKQDVDDPGYRPLVVQRREYEFLRENEPFLMVGTLEPKKGHIPTVRSFEAMWDAGLKRPLVVIGRKGWMEESVMEAIEQSRYYMDRLFWFDNFDDFDLYFAYRHSRGLIFSSYAEGFGIPMIEALSAGCPVVSLRTPIATEVVGRHGRFFDTFKQLAEHVSMLDSGEGIISAKQEIEHFTWPTWREITASLFDKLANADRIQGNDDIETLLGRE
jgi:alpha-1,2-rhamnosyltransferase